MHLIKKKKIIYFLCFKKGKTMQKALAFYLYDLNNFKLAKWMLFSLLTFTLGFLPEVFRFDNYSKLLWLIKLIENN
jgi:hypothetical protein